VERLRSSTRPSSPHASLFPPANRQTVVASIAGVLPPVIVRGQEVSDAVSAELKEVRDGKKSIEQALADAEKTVNAILAG
jgi:multiple sugar transport system substrate-binding protein